MEQSGPPRIHVYESITEISRAIASTIISHIRQTLAEKKIFDLVLAGGNTPRKLYAIIANTYRDEIPWERVRFFWSDERYIPYSDPRSNYGMARETLLSHLEVPGKNIFPMPTNLPTAEEAAHQYEEVLKEQFNNSLPHFDLMLMGMGSDCHIASLFPHTIELEEKSRWVVTGVASEEPKTRLSLTFPVINSAKLIHFLATGQKKAEAFRRAAQRIISTDDCPACGVRPHDGTVEWWVDKDAAGKLFRAK
jgi:6-phosphogluconolactonase